MQLPRQLIDEIVAHSLEDAPNECCGLVGAKQGVATTVLRAENLYPSPLRFEIANPVPLLRRIEEAGEDLAAIYHSHTRSEAYPSQTDINMAKGWPDPVWLICSVAEPGEPVVRGFEIRDGDVREVELDT